jgi:Xaa-Pro aminopeptidase
VRIEDDLLITRNGAQSLTDRIPKTVKDVEAAMGG